MRLLLVLLAAAVKARFARTVAAPGVASLLATADGVNNYTWNHTALRQAEKALTAGLMRGAKFTATFPEIRSDGKAPMAKVTKRLNVMTQAVSAAGTNAGGTIPEGVRPEGIVPGGCTPHGTNPHGNNPHGTNAHGTKPAGSNPAGSHPWPKKLWTAWDPCATGPPPVLTVSVELTVDLTLDHFPWETTWSLVSECDGTVVMSGGPYHTQYGTESASATVSSGDCCVCTCRTNGPWHTKPRLTCVCRARGTDHFQLNDAYGDGICCDGSYGWWNNQASAG